MSDTLAKRVLITGACGNIGRKLAAHLQQRGGYELVLLDRAGAVADNVVAADLSRRDTGWQSALTGVDCVVHLAATGRSTAPWPMFVKDNVDATLNLFEAAFTHQVRRVVFASSVQTMFGHCGTGVAIETDLPTAPVNFYGASKVFGERVAKWYSERGLSVICLRFGTVYPRVNRPRGARVSLDEQSVWLSDGDLCRACECAIVAEDVPFGVFHITSNAADSAWSLTETERVLGFTPADGVPLERLTLRARVQRRWRLWQRKWLAQ